MVDFLMLGIIPGTSIQINFQVWLNMAFSLISALIIALLIRSMLARYSPRLFSINPSRRINRSKTAYKNSLWAHR